MRDPYRKKQRDLRRIARSAQRPRIHDLFDVYHPEYKDYDRNYWRRKIDTQEWHFYRNAQNEWVAQIAGGNRAGWGGVPASFRRDRNRQLRTHQKAAVNRAFREDELDDFSLPRGRHDISWLWW